MAASFKNGRRLHFSPPHLTDLNAHRLVSKTQQNPSNYSGFLLKGLFITVAFALLPFCSSHLPEFTNHTNLDRRWEFLRLAFIGAALSYGLLSRRRSETEKEIEVRIESTQNYVSKILQVSPVFDGESDCGSYSDSGRLQTWSSLYYPCESKVMVAEEDRDRHDRPLFLPVRSLKSSISDTETMPAREITQIPAPANSKTEDSMMIGKRETGMSNFHGVDLDNVVLPSPVPWRSRSGRLEVKGDIFPSALYSLPQSVSGPEVPEFASPASLSSIPRPPSISPPHSLSPTPMLASVQDSATDPEVNRVSSVKDNMSSPVKEIVTVNKFLNSQSFEGVRPRKSISTMRKCESLDSTNGGHVGTEPEQTAVRSRRTFNSMKVENGVRKNKDDENLLMTRPDGENKSVESEAEEGMSRNEGAEFVVATKKRKSEVEIAEKTQSKSNFQPPRPPSIELYEEYRKNRHSAKEEIRELKAQVEAALVADDDDDDDNGDEDNNDEEEEEREHEEEEVDDTHSDTETVSSESESETDQIDESEVDKKADEFIAKFRQQIRQQRLPSR
ncbi:hypothetical protein EJ110_NYTH09882 [Nymphaea thermarum]|nr:hypothetical protein EJ110_NYTH09882 [Nymphaea thermarum]